MLSQTDHLSYFLGPPGPIYFSYNFFLVGLMYTNATIQGTAVSVLCYITVNRFCNKQNLYIQNIVIQYRELKFQENILKLGNAKFLLSVKKKYFNWNIDKVYKKFVLKFHWLDVMGDCGVYNEINMWYFISPKALSTYTKG